MVFMDDNFATIVAAVEEGRIIYDNIKKYLDVSSCPANVGRDLLLGMAGLVGPAASPAGAADTLGQPDDGWAAGLALGVEPAEPNLMRRPPRAADEPVFTTAMSLAISGMGLIMFFGLLPVFYVYWQAEGVAKGQTMVLVSMILFELLRAFSCRSMQFTIVQLGFFSNRWLVLANLSSALLMVAVIYIPSWATAFHTVSIGLSDWGVALGVGGADSLSWKGGSGWRRDGA